MENLVRAALVAALAGVVSMQTGCATVTRGRYQAWTVETAPSGAIVSLSNGERCETPCTLKLRRKYPFAVEICKTGYHAVNTTVQSQVSGAGAVGMAGNVILGGIIGAGVDVGTGAAKELKPNPLTVQMVQEVPGCEAPAFPPVPDGGETVEEHVVQSAGKSR